MRKAVAAVAIWLCAIGSCPAQNSTVATTRIATRIAPQSLATALKIFTESRHLQVLFLASDVKNLKTSGASGDLTVDEALSQLLNGTGLTYRYVDANAVSIIAGSHASRDAPSAPKRANATHRAQTKQDAKQNPEGGPSDPIGETTKSQTKSYVPGSAPLLEQVTVTGTHIKGVTPAYPVTTLTRMQILQSGQPTIGDFLSTSPLVFSGGVNPGAVAVGPGAIGNTAREGTGVSTANLFGIGTEATLTLVNGHELAGADELSSGDLSLIPMVAVQRIDIQLGASSAIYGSDAVAGAVNVTLRDHYDGEETSAYSGWTQGGGDFTERYSQLLGRSFDRGNVLLAGEFDKSDPLTARERDVSGGAAPILFLEPATKSGSALLNTQYSVTDGLEAHALGLYTHRTSDFSNTTTLTATATRVDEFYSDLGAKYDLADDQTIGLDITDAGYDQYVTGMLTPVVPLVSAIQSGVLGIDAYGSGRLVPLPAGSLSAAYGVGFRRENLNVEGSLSPQIGSRRVFDAYLELNVPVIPKDASRPGLEALRLDAAARYSNYSDFGSTTSPMEGITYVPFRSVKISGTYGSSFRAPTLYELYAPTGVGLYPGRLFADAPQGSEILYQFGGNRSLRAETAHTLTATLEFAPNLRNLPGRLHAAATYFDIRLDNRVGNPILSLFQGLANPLDQPFVIRDPSMAEQNGLIAAAGKLGNAYGIPYFPATVAALLNNSNQNMSSDSIHGASSSVDCSLDSKFGTWTATWAGTWLRFDERVLPGSGPIAISGTLFNPPNFKARGSVEWRRAEWNVIAFVNYLSHEAYLPPGNAAPINISSWTTLDGQIGYAVKNLSSGGASADLTFSVTNALNAAPPSVPAAAFYNASYDTGFDTSNASAVGRMFAVSVTVNW